MVTDSPLILVVDDESHIRDIVARILKKEGYRVITAPDGETALDLVKENDSDLVLLDLMLPGIDGREVCKRIRQFSTKIKVIYLSARPEPFDQLEPKDLSIEADAFISKPATSKQILSTVSEVLQSA